MRYYREGGRTKSETCKNRKKETFIGYELRAGGRGTRSGTTGCGERATTSAAVARDPVVVRTDYAKRVPRPPHRGPVAAGSPSTGGRARESRGGRGAPRDGPFAKHRGQAPQHPPTSHPRTPQCTRATYAVVVMVAVLAVSVGVAAVAVVAF